MVTEDQSAYLLGVEHYFWYTNIYSYVGIDADDGSIWGYRNMAPGYTSPTRWLQFNGIASGLPILPLSGWRFADLK